MVVRKETTYCDRCGEEMPHLVIPRFALYRKKIYIYRYGVDVGKRYIDLCESCSKDLEEWFNEKRK